MTSYVWNAAGLLKQLSLATGVVNTCTYNGDGLRVQKLDSGGTTKFVWDGSNVLEETDGSNVTQAVYTLRPELYAMQVSQRRSGTTSFYHFDALGSTVQLTNSSASTTDQYYYNAFGDLIHSQSSSTNSFRFCGQLGYYFDSDPAQYYVRARFYAPTWGRFLSCDPEATPTVRIRPIFEFWTDGIRPQLEDWFAPWNSLYRLSGMFINASGRASTGISGAFVYARGSPVHLNDPSGLLDCAERCEQFIRSVPPNPDVGQLIATILCCNCQSWICFLPASRRSGVWACLNMHECIHYLLAPNRCKKVTDDNPFAFGTPQEQADSECTAYTNTITCMTTARGSQCPSGAEGKACRDEYDAQIRNATKLADRFCRKLGGTDLTGQLPRNFMPPFPLPPGNLRCLW
jgi:RHS repeat-associated protein